MNIVSGLCFSSDACFQLRFSHHENQYNKLGIAVYSGSFEKGLFHHHGTITSHDGFSGSTRPIVEVRISGEQDVFTKVPDDLWAQRLSTNVSFAPGMAEQAQKPAKYQRRRPELTPCFKIVNERLDSFIQARETENRPLPQYVIDEFEAFIKCGIPAHGFLRLKCICLEYDPPPRGPPAQVQESFDFEQHYADIVSQWQSLANEMETRVFKNRRCKVSQR